MKAYIHRTAASENSGCDLKAIVPDPLMRRRLSRIVRDGVTAAAVCAEGHEVDAVITATAYGCLADSEKFLRVVIDNDEQLLPPSAFIQSTFNTVGATVALLLQRHCYNMTYAHGTDGFGTAILDALMLIDGQEARQVLESTRDPQLCDMVLDRARFQEELQAGKDRHEAALIAATSSDASIITSALVLFCATLGVSFVTSIDLIGAICVMLARGAVISAVVSIFVLPALLCVCEPVFNKTTLYWRKAKPAKVKTEKAPASK